LITSTLNEAPGYRVVRTVGLVRGSTIRARHLGRDFMAGLRGIVGGEITDYTKMLAEAREQALDRMMAEASSLGGNAVLGVRFGTSYLMAQAAEILVYGTAVLLEPTSGGSTDAPGPGN
jgi:uncharacterized protein YbjQ (UPF0145 family)